VNDTTIRCTYFARSGQDNTEQALQIAKGRAEALGIRSIVVATTRGHTGVRAAKVFKGYDLVIVTHSTGFKEPNYQELTEENRKAIEANGGVILTCEGMKVVCEITLMAADAGLIRVGEPAIAIAGTGRGADTAIVVKPANAQAFFDMRVMEILCKPGFYPDES